MNARNTRGGPTTRPSGRQPGRRPASKRRGPSRATIIRRRITALVMMLAVIGALVWAGFWVAPHIANLWGSIFSSDDEPAPVPEESETEVPTDRGPCQTNNLQLDYDVELSDGQAPVTFPASVTVDDVVGCLFDPAEVPVTAHVTSDGDEVWNSGECASRGGSQLLLAPQNPHDVTVTWDGTLAGEDCDDDSQSAQPGTYRVQFQLYGEEVDGARQTFELDQADTDDEDRESASESPTD